MFSNRYLIDAARDRVLPNYDTKSAEVGQLCDGSRSDRFTDNTAFDIIKEWHSGYAD